MPFRPIVTDRLRIRAFVESDIDAYHRRRNDPTVAAYQTWTLPVSRADSEERVAAVMAMRGPANEEWWMATLADLHSDEPVGDLALKMTWEMRCAEVGYTLDHDHWGKGYAVEAVQALVDHLFNTYPVTRVVGMLHPDNLASAQVLERTGFVWEGHTRNSFWVGDDNSDDWIYGQTPEDYAAWRDRPRTLPASLELVAVDQSNDRDVYRLKTHYSQRRFVSPMEHSFADALFPEIHNGHPLVPKLYGVVADGEYVAFVMLGLPTPGQREHYLWRLLVDRRHQRRGIGSMILDKIVEECRAMGAVELKTSWVPGRGSPEPFYLAYGFVPTGEVEDGEIVAVFPALTADSAG